jgi:hypothetical protein
MVPRFAEHYINEMETLMQIEQGDRLVLIRPRRLTDAVDTGPSEDATAPEFRLGAICSLEELEELWAIDREAYGEASITYDKFKDWWLSFPSGLLVLHWRQRIGGAIGLWPLSNHFAKRLRKGETQESTLTGRMMRKFRQASARYWYISGIVLRPELSGTVAIRVLLGQGISHWLNTAKIKFPCQILALSAFPEGEALLKRFGFRYFQKPHAMPDGLALFALDSASRNDLQLLAQRRLSSCAARRGC